MQNSKALNILVLLVILYALKMGQAIFLPFVIAVFFWALIYILSTSYSHILIDRLKLPVWTNAISKTLAIVTMGMVVYFIVVVIKDNIDAVSKTFDSYQKNMDDMLFRLQNHLGIERELSVSKIAKGIDFRKVINSVFQGFASFVSTSLMVLIYLFFILWEEKSFYKKFPKFFKTKKKADDALKTLKKIHAKIQIYLSVKFFLSALTGVLSYIVMTSVNLDFAMFWAIIIFLFNFIPNIGSIVSSVFPILLSLLQFNGDLFPFSVVAIGITVIQIVVGNIIDPKITGKKLNLSPLVLIVSLVIWGYVWGITGMFLCVPIMIIMTIILHQIPSTKKIAMFLTEDGEAL